MIMNKETQAKNVAQLRFTGRHGVSASLLLSFDELFKSARECPEYFQAGIEIIQQEITQHQNEIEKLKLELECEKVNLAECIAANRNK